MIHRRDFLVGGAALGAMAGIGPRARAADEWPQRQVTIIVPFTAGGSADLIGRLIASHLQTKYAVPFVVENRGGAGVVAKAAADGYTLGIGTVSTHAINASLYAHLPFDVERDFQPVTNLVQFPNLLVVNNKVPAKTVPDVIAYLKANEGKVNYGSSGNGTSSHLASVMFQLATGTKMTHVP